MKLRNDEALMKLTQFGFRCEEHTAEGFLRYSKRIGNLLITVANGTFENKIRLSMLLDQNGNNRVLADDLLVYTDMIGAMYQAGLIEEESYVVQQEDIEKEEYNMHENPLLGFPKKPAGFMSI